MKLNKKGFPLKIPPKISPNKLSLLREMNKKERDKAHSIGDCECRMTDDFTCPHCNGKMTDHEGHYVCECGFID